ncbi:DNA helicase [Dysgonomonas sp. Marseille-P4677]|uniref:replicative DNA helicase n=1 Tax=Dysgonomonas sp. Marseille-P4677 TaxID=2364790 RepID=UPI00191191B0|nr:DnaB-like helicase C-terminal domain-containing protein [Dysgonomonas sp. Marseille-P4677]MBK5721399.1 DNA helicase [Dysgonomonas sp. Marseille-P4677]
MDRLPPNDIEIEKIVLGTIISNKYGYDEVRDILNAECFYNDFHRRVFEIFKDIESKGFEPDAVGIVTEYKLRYNEIKAVEISSFGELVDVSGIYVYVCRLNDLSSRRKLIRLGNYLLNNSIIEQEDVSDIANYANECLSNLFKNQQDSIHTIRDAIDGVYKIIQQNLSAGQELTGSPTGFAEIDRNTGGLQKSDLVIIGGESSHGKTSLALSLVRNMAFHGRKIAFYSLEMKKEQLAARLMAMDSGVSSSKILFAPLDNYFLNKIDKNINSLYGTSIFFDDKSTSNIDNIINSIRTLKLKYDIDGAVIDYLQILSINMKGASEEQQLASVSRRLKNLAKELDIWVIALSQLNRDNHNPVPNRNRVRGSGQIFEAADIVYFVYQPSKYGYDFPEPFANYETNGYAMIIQDKGRNVGEFKFLTQFHKETTHFVDVQLNTIPRKLLATSDDNPF